MTKARQAEPATTFERRHIGPSPRDVAAMLEVVRAKSLDSLMGETLPPAIRQRRALNLPAASSETESPTDRGVICCASDRRSVRLRSRSES